MTGVNVAADTATTTPPVPEAVLERARAAVRKHFAECFWFRHPEAPLENADDVRVIIEHLREYGDHAAWKLAQDLHKCL